MPPKRLKMGGLQEACIFLSLWKNLLKRLRGAFRSVPIETKNGRYDSSEGL
jgi:hypothetical protein